MNNRFLLLLLTILIFLGESCSSSDTTILSQVYEVGPHNPDSALLLLQQIEKPGKLSPKDQADYYLAYYRCIKNKDISAADSLLSIAIEQQLKAGDSLKWLKLSLEKNANLSQNNPDSALYYNDNLVQYAKQLNNDFSLIEVLQLKRNIYRTKKDYLSALSTSNKILDLAEKINLNHLDYYKRTHYYILYESGREEEAINLITLLFNQPDNLSLPQQSLKRDIANYLTQYYISKNNTDSAIYYTDKSREYTRNRSEIPYYQLVRGDIWRASRQIDSAKTYYLKATRSNSIYIASVAHQRLQEINQEEGRLTDALMYNKMQHEAIEDIKRSNLVMKEKTEMFKQLQLKNDLYQLKLQQKKTEVWLTGTLSLLLLIAFVATYFFQKEKRKRLIAEQAYREKQLKQEAQKIQDENLLLKKENELIILKEKTGEMRDIIFRKISLFSKISLNNQSIEKSKGKRIVIEENEWEEVKQTINATFDTFVTRLKSKYPDLSEDDLRFCCLVKLNVSMQDLSDIYCVTKAAITKKKYRIKTDKLHLKEETLSLDDYLQIF